MSDRPPHPANDPGQPADSPQAAAALADGPLTGLRILDLSRILAGPTCTQLLGDLGAEVWKIERPGSGDDTRGWGPPFLRDGHGQDRPESAYYLCANRNKASLAIDIAHPDGQDLVRRLAAQADVVVENFKTGDLARYRLDAPDLQAVNPRLIVCQISGFGRTGPAAGRTGYDFLIQAMGGIMSITGPAEGEPHKAGVGIADVMCGMYATVAILAALRAREVSGRGQVIDLALYDTQVAWLINAATAWLTSGQAPRRHGNAHPAIVPYQVFQAADGPLALACGNDSQFRALCRVAGVPELGVDPRFATNAGRVRHREACVAAVTALIVARPRAFWLEALEAAGVPVGPLQTIPEVFADPQTLARGMCLTMPMAGTADGTVALIGNPIHLSETPVRYRRPPPRLGEHTRTILSERLGLEPAALDRLTAEGTIQ